MPVIEDGVVRQVWFAPATNPSAKNSFLIRDDAYSEREAVYGRTIRLGDPVDLGPFGAWRQTNWSGGHDQETWRDEAMYELGTADVSERKGSTKLWNGWTQIQAFGTRPGNVVEHLAPGATGVGDNVPLVYAERTLIGGTTPTDWKVRRYIPGSGAVEIDTQASPIQAITLIGNETGTATGYMLTGHSSGGIRRWDQSGGTWTSETVVGSGSIGYRCMAPFNNATYYIRGNRLQKRVAGTHTIVRQIPEITTARGMTVWNNRLWFIGIMSQGKSGIFVSDGYTVQLAFQIPGTVDGIDLCPHYGSLYFRGVVNRYGTVSGDVRQQVYRYNGSSVVLLWEDDDSDIDSAHYGGMASWGRHLVWSKHGSTALGKEPGVWLYDAEEDAVYMGPTFNMRDSSASHYLCTGVTVWNNTLAAAFVDRTTYTASTNQNPTWVAYLEKTKRPRAIKLDGTTTVDADKVTDTFSGLSGRSFCFPQTTKTQVILSSAYDANLAGEKKIWAKGYIRCRVPQGCQVRLALLHDDSPTEHPIKTVAYSAGVGSGWQDVQFSATCATHSTHEKSSKVRYKLYLENLDLGTYPNNTPEVDVVGLDFLTAPERRMSHHLRILARDDQQTLAGTPNSLTTRDAIVAKLKEYWDAAVPVLFWGPYSDGTTPVSAGTPVDLSNWLDQSGRITSDSTVVASEVSFDALEVA